MPRYKNPPKMIYEVRTTKGEWIKCQPECVPILRQCGLAMAIYRSEMIESEKKLPKKPNRKPKTQKKAKKTTETDTIEAPQDEKPPACDTPRGYSWPQQAHRRWSRYV